MYHPPTFEMCLPRTFGRHWVCSPEVGNGLLRRYRMNLLPGIGQNVATRPLKLENIGELSSVWKIRPTVPAAE